MKNKVWICGYAIRYNLLLKFFFYIFESKYHFDFCFTNNGDVTLRFLSYELVASVWVPKRIVFVCSQFVNRTANYLLDRLRRRLRRSWDTERKFLWKCVRANKISRHRRIGRITTLRSVRSALRRTTEYSDYYTSTRSYWYWRVGRSVISAADTRGADGNISRPAEFVLHGQRTRGDVSSSPAAYRRRRALSIEQPRQCVKAWFRPSTTRRVAISPGSAVAPCPFVRCARTVFRGVFCGYNGKIEFNVYARAKR